MKAAAVAFVIAQVGDALTYVRMLAVGAEANPVVARMSIVAALTTKLFLIVLVLAAVAAMRDRPGSRIVVDAGRARVVILAVGIVAGVIGTATNVAVGI